MNKIDNRNFNIKAQLVMWWMCANDLFLFATNVVVLTIHEKLLQTVSGNQEIIEHGVYNAHSVFHLIHATTDKERIHFVGCFCKLFDLVEKLFKVIRNRFHWRWRSAIEWRIIFDKRNVAFIGSKRYFAKDFIHRVIACCQFKGVDMWVNNVIGVATSYFRLHHIYIWVSANSWRPGGPTSVYFRRNLFIWSFTRSEIKNFFRYLLNDGTTFIILPDGSLICWHHIELNSVVGTIDKNLKLIRILYSPSTIG